LSINHRGSIFLSLVVVLLQVVRLLQYQHCGPDHCAPVGLIGGGGSPSSRVFGQGGLPMMGPDGIDGAHLFFIKVGCGGSFLHSSNNYKFGSFIVLLDDFQVQGSFIYGLKTGKSALHDFLLYVCGD
jgi:hypothetical protein